MAFHKIIFSIQGYQKFNVCFKVLVKHKIKTKSGNENSPPHNGIFKSLLPYYQQQ